MKKFLALMLALVMIVGCFAFVACNEETPDKPGDGNTDTPGEGDAAHKHTGGEATCTKKAVCADCGEEYGDLAKHSYKDGVCKVCGAVDPEAEAEQKAAEEAAAPVIELIKKLENLPAITADNVEDIKAKYDAANGAYNDLEKAAKKIVGDDNKALLTAAKKALNAYEDSLKAAAALQEYYQTLGTLPTNLTAKFTVTLDGKLDENMIALCTPMTLTKAQCDIWNNEGRKDIDGAGVVGDTTLTEGAQTDVSFYVAYDDNYLYIVEWRTDLNWCFSAQDYKKSYTGDGSLIWFVNTAEAEEWLASGSMSSKPAFGLMWNAGVGGEKAGENTPQIAYYPKDDQSAPDEKTASGKWNYSLGWDDTFRQYYLEVAIPWADLPITMADMDAGNISATFCSVDIVNPEFDGDSSKLWTGMGYQMQYPGVNHWHLAQPLEPNND